MNSDMKKSIVKASFTGLANAVAGAYYFGSGNVSVFGMSLPVYAPLAVSGFASSYVTDMIHENVLNMLPLNQNFANIESLVVGAGISGLANLGILSLAVGSIPSRNYIPSVLIGGGAYVAGDWASNRLLSNDDNELIF
jgi:hypothetical protein